MIIETLHLSSFSIISANTDGVVVLFKKSRIDEFRTIQREWEKRTKFQLEETFYDLLVMSNVNNYLAVKTGDAPIDERVKQKGWFETIKEPHKNHSMSVVSKALYDYYIHGIDYRKTIYNTEDIYDFCKAVKSKGGSTFELHDVLSSTKGITKLDKTVRYFVSVKGQKLIKDMPPLKESVYEGTLFDGTFTEDRSMEIESGYLVTYFNNFSNEVDFSDYSINYNYYINEVEKIINPIKIHE